MPALIWITPKSVTTAANASTRRPTSRAIAIDHIDDPDDELDQAPESWYGPDDPFMGYDEDQEEE